MRLFLGGLNPFLYYLVLFKAYSLLPAQEAQALNYTWALTMALLAAPLLGHPLKRIEILAALISYCGVLVIATRGQLLALDFANPLGVGLALLSTVLWAFYWIFNTGSRQDPVAGLFLNFCFALPMLLVYCLWSGELTAVPWRGVAGAVYVGVFEMGVSFILWLHAMKLTRSTIRISSLIFMAPPLSLLLIHHVLGEVVLPSTLGGLALILLGLAVQHRNRRERLVSIYAALSPVSSTPRASWSRSIDSNSAWKLPSPKPSSRLRWMNSKKIGPMTVSEKICSSRRGSPSSVEPSSRIPRDFSTSIGSP